MIASYKYSKLEKRSKVIKKNIRNVFSEILFKKLAQKYSLTDVVIRNQRNSIEYSFLNVVRLNTLFSTTFLFFFIVFVPWQKKKSGENYLK